MHRGKLDKTRGYGKLCVEYNGILHNFAITDADIRNRIIRRSVFYFQYPVIKIVDNISPFVHTVPLA